MNNNFDDDDVQTQKAILIDHLIALTVPLADPISSAHTLANIYKIADSGIIEKCRLGNINVTDFKEKLKFIIVK